MRKVGYSQLIISVESLILWASKCLSLNPITINVLGVATARVYLEKTRSQSVSSYGKDLKSREYLPVDDHYR